MNFTLLSPSPAACDPTLISAKSCLILETEVVIFFVGPLDEDKAIYEAYIAIKDSMTKKGGYVDTIPTIVKLKFLSPSPLPVPPGSDEGGNVTAAGGGPTAAVESNANSISTASSGVNSWTIGASVVTLIGGLASMFIYARNRRRHQSGQQLTTE